MSARSRGISSDDPERLSDDRSAQAIRTALIRQASSLSLAVMPFGVAFGVLCERAGLSVAEALSYSVLVFTGGGQFAAVSVLEGGGTIAAAVIAASLLNLRLLAFGVIMAPALRGPLLSRALAAHLMIDESTAVGSSVSEPRWQRFGYLATGIGIFVLWNLSTLLGVSVLGGADELITTLGVDATIPAAFLALVWPRLVDRPRRFLAAAGAGLAFVTAPVLPPGLPIIVAAGSVLLLRPWRPLPTTEPTT